MGSRLRCDPSVLCRRVGDTTVLYRYESDDVAVLDSVASAIWQTVDADTSTGELAAIVDDVATAFGIGADEAAPGVTRVIDDLVTRGFIELTG